MTHCPPRRGDEPSAAFPIVVPTWNPYERCRQERTFNEDTRLRSVITSVVRGQSVAVSKRPTASTSR